jgi:hypothetical protein
MKSKKKTTAKIGKMKTNIYLNPHENKTKTKMKTNTQKIKMKNEK